MGDVVDLHAVGHDAGASSSALKLVCDEGHFMASFDQTLTKLIAVGLDSTKFGECKVSTDENAVSFVFLE